MRRNILFLIAASTTEARTLIPIIKALQVENISTTCLIARHEDTLLYDTERFLGQNGIPYEVTGKHVSLSAEQIINQYRPNIVVMANDSLIINRFIIHICNNNCIPTVLIQEAPSANYYLPISSAKRSILWILKHYKDALFLSRSYIANDALGELCRATLRTISRRSIGNRGYGFANVSLFCVFSEFDMNSYRDNGSKARRIIPTGIPAIIDFSQSFNPQSPKDYDFILFTTCEGQVLMTEDEQLDIYHQIVGTLRFVQPNARIGIKFHPRENRQKFYNLEGVHIVDTMDQAFTQGRMMIGTITTVLTQALLTGYPIVTYQPNSHFWPPMFLTESCRSLDLLATNETELARLVADAGRNQIVKPEIVAFRQFWLKRLNSTVATIRDLILELCASV